jgi:hypothetical protein
MSGSSPWKVAVAAPFLHRLDRAHAAVELVGAALEENRLAGALLGAGEEAADHDAVGAGGDRLGDVAREANAAVGDDRDVAAFDAADGAEDGGHLRHADAGDDAGRADRADAHADLDGVGAGLRRARGALFRADVAGDDVEVAVLPLDVATVSRTFFEWPCAVSTASTSTPARISASTRASRSAADADRAPTRRRPRSSLQAKG